MSRGARLALRIAITLALFAVLAWRVNVNAVATELAAFHPGWGLAALALTLPQVVVSAWRWRLTARRLGLELSFAGAVREYYRATFLNQVLPGGVLGDASRAWRHARSDGDRAGAIHAVMIERVSGQLALVLIAVAALAAVPQLAVAIGAQIAAVSSPVVLVSSALALALFAAAAWAAARRGLAVAPLARFAGDLRRALLDRRIGLVQLASSLCVVASYVAVFVLSAKTIGSANAAGEVWVRAPLVLMAMAIPLSVAGWGIRESAAALLWNATGLAAAQGVAISLAYGAVVLISSLPGGWFVLWARRRPVTPRPGPTQCMRRDA